MLASLLPRKTLRADKNPPPIERAAANWHILFVVLFIFNVSVCHMNFDVEKIRGDFPVLSQTLDSGRKLVYFDNAATAQKPQSVIDAVCGFYSRDNSNIHRSAHELAGRATRGYETARAKVEKFFGAGDSYSAVFTRGTTESINLIAATWGIKNLKAGDEILLSAMEHHANIVPWQLAAQRTGSKIVVANIRADGSLDMDDLKDKISAKTKIVSIAHASNVLGTVNDIAAIGELAHKNGALFSVDAAQSAPHLLDSETLKHCDFLSCSGHKCFGPTGIGALIARREILDSMPPYQGGGDMIENVSWAKTTFRPAPEKFEAGTPNIAGAIGFGAAIDYMGGIDKKAAHEHEQKLLEKLTDGISSINGLKIYGSAKGKAAVVSFAVKSVHPNDISSLLDADGIAVRTGHHCAEPLVTQLGEFSLTRASLSFYNTEEEVEIFVESLKHAVKLLS